MENVGNEFFQIYYFRIPCIYIHVLHAIVYNSVSLLGAE